MAHFCLTEAAARSNFWVGPDMLTKCSKCETRRINHRSGVRIFLKILLRHSSFCLPSAALSASGSLGMISARYIKAPLPDHFDQDMQIYSPQSGISKCKGNFRFENPFFERCNDYFWSLCIRPLLIKNRLKSNHQETV
jgi:hypothetical protein